MHIYVSHCVPYARFLLKDKTIMFLKTIQNHYGVSKNIILFK